MTKMLPKMVLFSRDTMTWLRRESKQRGVSSSEVVRKAVERERAKLERRSKKPLARRSK